MSSDGNGGSYPGLISNMNPAQENEVDINREQPSTPLDLKLTRTPSSMKKIEQVGLAQERQKNRSKSDKNEKLRRRPAYFRIKRLRIGEWQTISSFPGHLNAKIYFLKKQLAWEIFDLGKGLKKTIQFSWSDILAIRAKFIVNKPSVLEIVLNRAPSLQSAIKPEHRRRQAQLEHTVDFTKGQASTWRIHVVEFPPGRLNRYYKMLLQSDPRLFELSQKPFPSPLWAYFQPNPNEPQYNNDVALPLGKEMNPSTSISVTGSSHGNELVQFNNGSRIDTTMVQQGNYNQVYPMNHVEQATTLSHPDDEPEYCPDLEDEIDKYLYGSPDEPEIGVESAPFHPQLRTIYNPSTQMPGCSHGNELMSSNTGLRIDTTMVQPINYILNYPMNYDEQTPMLSHPYTSVLNPQRQPKYCPDLEDELEKYLYGSPN